MLMETISVTFCTVAAGYVAIKLFCPWFLGDLNYLTKFIPALIKYVKLEKNNTTLADVFEARAAAKPDNIFILYEGRKYTYKEVNEQANRVARVGISLGLKNRGVVSLMMYNEPAYIWTVLGFLKIGVTVSMINTNLRDKSLLHCLTVSETDIIIVGQDIELIDAAVNVCHDLPNATFYVQGCPKVPIPGIFKSFYELMNQHISENTDPSLRKANVKQDKSLYIFTSGTTGLPKPALITHKRTFASTIIGKLAGITKDDVFYITLPLYHSSSFLVGLVNVINQGAVCVLSKKFSKTKYMKECRDNGVTVIIYIGEVCRYLLSNEKSELDRQNSIRLAIGNGLRQDIFQEFQERFAIDHVREFYAATEGPAGFVNCDDVTGTIGRCTPFTERALNVGFFKYDIESDSLVRDASGHCVKVAPGQPGLFMAAITKLSVFDGYKGNPKLTECKIVRNVKKDGDVFFNSGDLMIRDTDYYLYFNDRIGDTFRWKGENVSTTEVSNTLTDIPWIEDACVFGVDIPGEDGKAGMAALLLSHNMQKIGKTELEEFTSHCERTLPVYARPIFIRVKCGELDMTSTLKQSKTKLKQESYNMDCVADTIFYFDKISKSYKPLTRKVCVDIKEKRLMF